MASIQVINAADIPPNLEVGDRGRFWPAVLERAPELPTIQTTFAELLSPDTFTGRAVFRLSGVDLRQTTTVGRPAEEITIGYLDPRPLALRCGLSAQGILPLATIIPVADHDPWVRRDGDGTFYREDPTRPGNVSDGKLPLTVGQLDIDETYYVIGAETSDVESDFARAGHSFEPTPMRPSAVAAWVRKQVFRP